jgi:3-deoxy-7-phosphoheptulonate synthase
MTMNGPYILTLNDDADLDRLLGELARAGCWARRLETSNGRTVRLVEIDGRSTRVTPETLAGLAGVAAVSARPSSHPLVDARAGQAAVIGAVRLGGANASPVLMAGPCAVESERQIHQLAEAVAAAGGQILRGSAYKPRTSPYAFQGHGAPALAWLRQAADRQRLAVVTEVLAPEDAGRVAEVADLVQIGSRNMQNFALLRAAGKQKRPILLKRGVAATVEEWLQAGEYCLAEGAPSVVFCERGVRGFDPSMRNLLDLGTVALLAHALRLPVIVDPSHAAGRRDLIPALARAGLAAGAHGLLVETHADPASALSDGPQALPPADLASLCPRVR